MELKEGHSLVDFVNRNSTRFAASVFDFTSECWVLVADKEKAGKNGQPVVLEPVADFGRYLIRARREGSDFPAEYVRLLELWEDARPAI